MSQPKLSIVVPTIRTHLLEDLYRSFCYSCPTHTFEVIFVGPFDIPTKLMKKSNVKYIKDYGHPTRAAQIGGIEAEGELVCLITDDCFCYSETLADTIDFYDKECLDTDIIGMRFFENPEHYQAIKSKKTEDKNPAKRLSDHPDDYWLAGSSYGGSEIIKPYWGTACLFMVKTEIFKNYGGWDCQWEHLNHSTHDLLFRMQSQGSRFFLTDYDVFVANWYEGNSVDHAPVNQGQTEHDEKLFRDVWSKPSGATTLTIVLGEDFCLYNTGYHPDPPQFYRQYKINIDNWRNCPDVWSRRFGMDKPKKYTDLYTE